MNPRLFSIIFVMTHTRTSMNTAPLNRQGSKHSSMSPSILSFIKATFPKKNIKNYCPPSIFYEHSSVHHKTKRKPQNLENIVISILTHNSVFPCRKKYKYKNNSKIKNWLSSGWTMTMQDVLEKKSTQSPMKYLGFEFYKNTLF